MSENNSIDEELQKIITQRGFSDILDWEAIRTQIPIKVKEILTKVFHAEFNKIIIDPLNPTSHVTIEAFYDKLMTYLHSRFNNAPPFTIVRISEILTSPTKHYNKPEKFLRALEHALCVSSTTEDFDTEAIEYGKEQKDAASNVGKTESRQVLSVRLNDDGQQTMLLTKIDWLTKEDIEEIESENYLPEAEYQGSYDPSAYSQENEDDYYEEETEEETEESDEDFTRKRKVEETREAEPKSDESTDSPEKKHKADKSDENSPEKKEDTSIADISVQEELDFEHETLQHKYERALITGLGPALEVSEEDEVVTPTDEVATSEFEINADPDITLEEDRMDIDTTF